MNFFICRAVKYFFLKVAAAQEIWSALGFCISFLRLGFYISGALFHLYCSNIGKWKSNEISSISSGISLVDFFIPYLATRLMILFKLILCFDLQEDSATDHRVIFARTTQEIA